MIGDAKAETIGLHQLKYSPTVSVSSIPPWLFHLPSIDLNIQQELEDKSEQLPVWCIVQNYFDQHFSDSVFIFRDGSKDPGTGCAGSAVYIPRLSHILRKEYQTICRYTPYTTVYYITLLLHLTAFQH